MRCTSLLCRISASLAVAGVLALAPALRAQQAIQVYLSAVDADGKPVTRPFEHAASDQVAEEKPRPTRLRPKSGNGLY